MPAMSGDGQANPSARRTSKGSGRHQRSQAFAAIDLGTINCRLLIARETLTAFGGIIDSYSKVVRLWQVSPSGERLREKAWERARRGAKNLRRKMKSNTSKRWRCVGD